MTKKELHATVTEAITEVIGENPEVQAILDEYLAPKVGGGKKVNLDEITRKDENGNIVELQCATSGKWLPASLEYFYEDKSENPRIIGIEGKGLKRQSKEAEKFIKDFNKKRRATLAALTDDLLNAEDPEEIAELKERIRETKESKPDLSQL